MGDLFLFLLISFFRLFPQSEHDNTHVSVYVRGINFEPATECGPHYFWYIVKMCRLFALRTIIPI